MFAFFGGASLKIARNLIQVTGLKESLAVFQKNNFSNIGGQEVLKLLLAVDACNLLQTLKEDFIAREIGGEDLQDAVEDYVVENLKDQSVIPCRDGAERMDQCQEILGLAAKFQENWTREDAKDPGPRFYCVKELLRRLNCEANTPIHDNLFEFVYQQHNRFIRYFRTLLEPFRTESSTESQGEPPPLAVAIRPPAEPESAPAGPSGLETAFPAGMNPMEPQTPSPAGGPSDPRGKTQAEGFNLSDRTGKPLEKKGGLNLDSPDTLMPWPVKATPPPAKGRQESPVEAQSQTPEEAERSGEGKEETGGWNLDSLDALMPRTQKRDPPAARDGIEPPPGKRPPGEPETKTPLPAEARAFRALDLEDTLSGFPGPGPLPMPEKETDAGSDGEDEGEISASGQPAAREAKSDEGEIHPGDGIAVEGDSHSAKPTSRMLEDLFEKVNPIEGPPAGPSPTARRLTDESNPLDEELSTE